jgi:hypothetical protein
MSNPFSGIISAPFKQLFDDAINAILEETALTVPCKLLFKDTKITDCPNCIYDSISRRSSNQYQTGGPLPFVNGQICPYCAGIGSLTFSAEENVSLGLIKPVFFKYANLDLEAVNFVDGKIQSLCNISYYAKIKNASSIIIDTNITGLSNSTFIRFRDPVPVGFGNNTFMITTWQGVQ